jgi:hypothetical protein
MVNLSTWNWSNKWVSGNHREARIWKEMQSWAFSIFYKDVYTVDSACSNVVRGPETESLY